MAAKRLFDLVFASLALIVLSPLLAVVGLAIILEDGRPVIYSARRAGLNGQPIRVHKFRTMRKGADRLGPISAANDQRVTRTGVVLRRLKIDELPQLANVLKGEMSIVGPRPEDLDMVMDHYAAEHWRTLSVRPGLASPGSLYNYTHGERALDGQDYQTVYLTEVLPTKLALESVYVERRSFTYDCRIVVRTLWTIGRQAVNRPVTEHQPEMSDAQPVSCRNLSEATA